MIPYSICCRTGPNIYFIAWNSTKLNMTVDGYIWDEGIVKRTKGKHLACRCHYLRVFRSVGKIEIRMSEACQLIMETYTG